MIFKDNIMLCDEVKTPFILGMIRPLIYVPSALEGERMEMVCAHEKAHISRHDHWWKPFGFALLSVYWFNPLCWLAYILLCRDIEAACDEKVIKDKDREYMAAYSQALLELSVSGKIITACPLAFGETGVKSRIKGILNYKKPAFWIILIALIACAAVAVCFLTNPKKKEADTQAEEINALENMDVDYTYEDGVYVAEDRDGKELRGRDPGEKLNTEYMPAETIAKDSKFWQPPTVTVTYAGRAYAASQGWYNWSYVDEQGEGHSTCADSAHPLDAIDRMSRIDLQKDTDTLDIHLTYSPVKLSYRYWEPDPAGKALEYEKDYTALMMSDDIISGSEDASLKIPADTPLIIELYGEWEYGTSSYYFAILPKETSEDSINYWIDLDLPVGCTRSGYSDYTGYMGGSYILPHLRVGTVFICTLLTDIVKSLLL